MTFINPKTFECTKCGECCRPIVKVCKEEISQIEKAGIKKEEFTDFDKDINSYVLKQNKGVCMFLKRDVNEKGDLVFVCSIYDKRPDVCRKYPFFTGKEKLIDCRPGGYERWIDIDKVVK